jgi:RNA polymerase sigma factor (sigma-70 family)
MGQKKDAEGDSNAAERLILRTVAAHADSLLRTARRHSICADDAQDAYQRTLELFMARADRLDPDRVAGWLHVVVKREAQAICRSRKKMLGPAEVDPDGHAAEGSRSLEERILSQDLIGRAAEALQRLKPQELQAIWLKAEGHSYNEIAAITGWSYTKVNRCLTEGRRSFLRRFASIESGAECVRWMGTIAAIVDGEATPEQIGELRPHLRNCPGCRATLKALQDSSGPLSVVLPVPLAAVASGGGEQLGNVFMRAYEAIAGGFHERAVHSVTKAQAAIEAAAGGKVAAVAASAAAAAGGGYATVERTVTGDRADRTREARRQEPVRRTSKVQAKPATVITPAPPLSERRIVAPPPSKPNKTAAAPASPAPAEFEPTPAPAPVRAAAASAPAASTSAPSWRGASSTQAPVDSTSSGAGEFGP